MANVLGTLFQDIADAIRTKTGGTDTMAPANFPAEILAITTGSGGDGGSAGAVVAASGTITKPSGLVTVEHGLGVTPDVIVVWVPSGGGNQPPETTRYTEFELGMSQAFLDKFSIDTGGVSYASDDTVADKVGGYDTTETRGIAWDLFGWIFVPKGNTEHFQVGTVSANASQTYYSGTNYTWLAIGGLT